MCNFCFDTYNGPTNSAWNLGSAFYLKTSFRVGVITPLNTQVRLLPFFFFFLFYDFIYLFDRERESVHTSKGNSKQREREKQAPH